VHNIGGNKAEIENPRVIAVILARGGSKSVEKKNIKMILGNPLIAYTISEAKLSKYIDRIIVSSDDDEIRRVATECGAEAPFKRPEQLATDEAPSLPAIQHAVKWAEDDEGMVYDYVVELMCTNPLKTVEDIDGAINKLFSTGADSVIGVSQVFDKHPIRMKKIIDDRIVDYCLPEIPETRRQDLMPPAYIRNGSIYAVKRNLLMIENTRYGTKESRPWIMPEERSINVDEPVDFLVAESIMKQYRSSQVQRVLGERKKLNGLVN